MKAEIFGKPETDSEKWVQRELDNQTINQSRGPDLQPRIQQLVDTIITLDQPTHSYCLENYPDLQFNSVTTIVDRQFPPFEKERIARYLSERSTKYKQLSPDEIIQGWEDTKNHGTAVHKELDDYVSSDKAPSLPKALSGKECFDKEIGSYGDKMFSELIVYSKELKVAGTVDLLTYDSEKNECYIFDWKTSKKIDETYKKKGITPACHGLGHSKINQYSLQLSMYAFLLEEFHDIKIKGCYIVHLLEDDYKLIKAEDLRTTVELVLETY